MRISIAPVNDAPVARDDSVQTAADVPVTIDVLANDFDVDGDRLQAHLASAPQRGSVVVAADGRFVYTPLPGFNGSDSFSYLVDDGNLVSRVVTVTIFVGAAPNRAPDAADDDTTTAEDTPLTIDVLANDSDADGDALGRPRLVQAAARGTVVQLADGRFVYTPAADFHGVDSFSYAVSDARGGSSRTATVRITVTPVNDAPQLAPVADRTLAEGQTLDLQLAGSDVDSDALRWELAEAPAGATIDAAGRLRWTAPDGDASARFVVRVVDVAGATATRSFDVGVSNVAPTVQASGAATASVGAAYVLALAYADPGADSVRQWSIDWGDGSVSLVDGNATSASHVYADGGARRIVATAIDDDGAWAAAEVPLTVLAVPGTQVPPPSAGPLPNGPLPPSPLPQAVPSPLVSSAALAVGGSQPGRVFSGLADVGTGALGAALAPEPPAFSVGLVSQSVHRFSPTGGDLGRSMVDLFDRPPPGGGTGGSGTGDAGTLRVRGIVVTPTGLRVRFNQPFDGARIGIRSESGESFASASVVVLRDGVPLRGVLLVDPDSQGFVFIAEGGTLPAGDYRIVLVAADGRIVTLRGEVLDGDGDGKPGGDFEQRLRVGPAPAPLPAAAAAARDDVEAAPSPTAAPSASLWPLLASPGALATLAAGTLPARRHNSEDRLVRARKGWLGDWLGGSAAADGGNRWRIRLEEETRNTE